MTKSGSEGHTVESVVQQFSAAESALRELVIRSEELASAELRVDQARASVELATTDLGRSREAVESGATGLHSLAKQLERTAREFTSAAQALNEMKPDEIMTVGEETQAIVHQLGTRLGKTKDELVGLHQGNSALITAVQQSVSDVRASVGDVRIAISSVVSQVSNDANETRTQCGQSIVNSPRSATRLQRSPTQAP